MSPQQQQEAMAYQQAFLQNAVAQNMQIQQQLLVQNQALTQLLQGSASGPNSASMTTMMGTPMPSMMPQVVNPGASGAASSAAALIVASQQHEPGTYHHQNFRRASADNLLEASQSGGQVWTSVIFSIPSNNFSL